jgi:hypothetical protein
MYHAINFNNILNMHMFLVWANLEDCAENYYKLNEFLTDDQMNDLTIKLNLSGLNNILL